MNIQQIIDYKATVLALILLPFNALATTFWVSPSGDDANNCTSENSSCRSIGAAMPLANTPGDIVNIKAGTYNTAQPGCNFYEHNSIACPIADGTPTAPIIIQAAPGDEGKVILDGGRTLIGINIKDHDYITVRNLELANISSIGIAGAGQRITNMDKDDNTGLSVGVIIENNYIHDVYAIGGGKNPGGIRLDGSKDWVIRNNKIDTVCGGTEGCLYINAGCIYSYVVINATVENNECSNSGALVHWKDHVVDLNGQPTIKGSTVRNNISHDTFHGFYISHGDQNPESSNHTVTNNIFYNIHSSCMALFTDTADGAPSTNYTFNNNVCDGADVGIYSMSAQITSSKGNIFSNVTGFPSAGNSDIYRFFDNDDTRLDASDYNVFSPSFPRVNMSNPTASLIFYNLTSWNSATLSTNRNINTHAPDINSVEALRDTIFNDVSGRDYTLKAGSPALGIMPDGSNAGAYQYGNEIIGLLPGYPEFERTTSAKPKHPPQESIRGTIAVQ